MRRSVGGGDAGTRAGDRLEMAREIGERTLDCPSLETPGADEAFTAVAEITRRAPPGVGHEKALKEAKGVELCTLHLRPQA